MSLRKNPIDFTMGVDGEFIVLDKNRLICDKAITGKESWGCDGSGKMRITEIRAKPFTNPLKIINNIREIFQEKVNNNPNYFNYRWVAGSFVKNRPIGLHSHYGVLKNVIRPEVAIIPLEQYVGSISVLLEKREEGRKRRENYGFYTDWRAQPHGFEQRSFGCSLSSPHATAGILCLGKTVMYELLNNPTFKWNTFVNGDDFYLMNTFKIRSKFPQIWSDIQKMTLYPKYKKHIDFLKFLVDNNLTFITKRDLKYSWGIIKPISAPKPVIPKIKGIEFKPFDWTGGFVNVVAYGNEHTNF